MGRPDIGKIDVTALAGATIQIAGVRTGRFSPGSAMRSTGVPTDTTANANSVPVLTSSPTRPIDRKPARTATTAPEPTVETYGVWKRGWIFAAALGSKPSCAP